jgi:hypothetical protein
VNRHRPATLQINLAPGDLRTARHTLPHQLRQWAGQVDEVLLTLDPPRGNSTTSRAAADLLPGMLALIAECCAQHPHARLIEVDYGRASTKLISDTYFGGAPAPSHDHRGAPFFAYLFGLHQARHDLVLHMDSDMMFGGGSQTWLDEAAQLMESNPNVLACNPLPGPPTANGRLRSQRLAPWPKADSPAFASKALSTRIMAIDRARLQERVVPVPLVRPPVHKLARALATGMPVYNPAEVALSRAMRRRGLLRVDFLGRAPGMWGVHPLYRSERFYARLPSLIDDIESGRVAERQRGDHELNSSMVDWAGARTAWPNRMARHLKTALSR